MELNVVATAQVNTNQILKYYSECWLKRFEQGHNPLSLAMHLGYFNDYMISNDLAKLEANTFLSDYINIPADKEIAIADLGCGVGGTCLYLAENFPRAKITGVNIADDQVSFAEKLLLERPNRANINYVTADYTKTPMPDNLFDFVIGIESICHATVKESVYREAYRILKPGGVFSFMDYFEVRLPENSTESHLLSDFRKGWVVDAYICDYKTELLSAGFKNIVSTLITEKVAPGIRHSYSKAVAEMDLLKQNGTGLMKNHLHACIALQQLIDLKIIQYKIVRASK